MEAVTGEDTAVVLGELSLFGSFIVSFD